MRTFFKILNIEEANDTRKLTNQNTKNSNFIYGKNTIHSQKILDYFRLIYIQEIYFNQ